MFKSKKNVILTAILLILIILAVVLFINRKSIQESLLKSNLDKNYTFFYGTVTENKDDLVTIEFDNDYQETFDNQKEIVILLNDNNLTVGDHIKVYYEPNKLDLFKSGDELLDNPLIEILGKTRMFNPNTSSPISNSNYPAGAMIYSSIASSISEQTIINEFNKTDSGFYIKKIIDYFEYEKYKDSITGLRDLKEDDFVNYYLVLILSKSNLIYTYNTSEISDEDAKSINVILKESTPLNPEQSEPFNGIYLVLPNTDDIASKNIFVKSSDNVYNY